MKKFNLTLTFIGFLVYTYAQGGPAGPPPPTPGVPFGAVEYLLAGLGIYAYKKFNNSKK